MFSEPEYTSLRNELITRIEMMNDQAFHALSFIITTWAAGFSLIGMQLANNETRIDYFFSYGEIIAFLSAIWLLYPLAVKSGQNITQISTLSAYIRVFHEYLNDKQILRWETANNLISTATANKPSLMKMLKKKQIEKYQNAEYLFLSLASFCFMLLCDIYSFYIRINYYNLKGKYLFLSVLADVFFIVLGIYGIYSNDAASSVKKNMMDKNKQIVYAYIDFAYKSGLMTKAESDKAKLILNPEQIIEEFEHVDKQRNT